MNKFFVVAVTMIKNEVDYIEEWIAYHYACLGIDHFIVYNNNSTDDIHSLLRRYINHGIVTLIEWPKFGGQMEAYNNASMLFGGATEWMFYFDVDEFLVLHRHNNIRAFLESLPADASQVKIPWRNFGFSGHVAKPHGLVIENFDHSEDIPDSGFAAINGKAISRSSHIAKAFVHNTTLTSGTTVNASGEIIEPGGPVKNPRFEIAQLNHYFTRSVEEFEQKISRGQSDGGAEKRVFGLSAQRNYNTIDRSIYSKVEPVKAFIRDFHDYSEDPARYGTFLRHSFPWHFLENWDFERCLSNHIHNVPTVRIAFKNLDPHRLSNALLFRIEEADLLSGDIWQQSIHLRDFLRKSRASVIVDAECAGEQEHSADIVCDEYRRYFLCCDLQGEAATKTMLHYSIGEQVWSLDIPHDIERAVLFVSVDGASYRRIGQTLLRVKCEGAVFQRVSWIAEE
jgi:hypothetical protein